MMMGITFLRTGGEEEPVTVIEGIRIEKVPTLKASVESFRVPSVWHLILDKSYSDAVEKLKEIVQSELQITEPDVIEMVPCIVDIKEGKTETEKERINRAHKAMGKAFSSLVDRLVRFRPESRNFAFDAFQQQIMDSSPLWKPFECQRFRPKEEIDGSSQEGKKKRATKKRS